MTNPSTAYSSPRAEECLPSNAPSLLEKYCIRFGDAFLDGMVSTMDFMGTIAGHITKNKNFLGYDADKFSTFGFNKDRSIPKERELDEQFFKAAGDVFGLAGVVISCGGLPLGIL